LSGVDAAGAAAGPDRQLVRCDAAIAEAAEWAGRAVEARPRPRRLRAGLYQRAYLRQVLTVHEAARPASAAYATTGVGAATAADAWRQVRSEAAFRHDHVRPTVLRLGARWLPEPYARALERPGDSFPADLPAAVARSVRALERLLDAMPAAQLAALLPADEAVRDAMMPDGQPGRTP
jgi:hypothetical protein